MVGKSKTSGREGGVGVLIGTHGWMIGAAGILFGTHGWMIGAAGMLIGTHGRMVGATGMMLIGSRWLNGKPMTKLPLI